MANLPLPGFRVQYKDGGLTPGVPLPTTERLLIIGNALDGPINQARIVRSFSEAEALYGPMTYKNDYKDPNTNTNSGAYADNNLLKGLHEAVLGGAGDIVMCRVGGTYAIGTSTLSPSVTIASVYPGRIYNGIQVIAASGVSTYTITVVQPTSKGGTQTYTFNNTDTLGYMTSVINNDSRNKTIIVTIPNSEINTAITSLGVGTITLSGATNGTGAPGEDFYASKENYYTALTEADGGFDSLFSTEFDVAVLCGIYADDQIDGTNTNSVAIDFGEFLHKVHKETRPCLGVIGLRPTGLKTPSTLGDFAESAYLGTTAGYYNQTNRWIKFGPIMYESLYYQDPDTNENVDVGRYLSVVAGPDLLISQKEIGYYNENGSAVYAGMITNLLPHKATSFKPVGSIKNVVGAFSKNTHELLNQGVGRDQTTRVAGGGAYVTFRFNTTIGRPIVVSDNTAAQRGSDFQTLQTFRIANVATRMAQQVLYPFLGNENSPQALAAMKTGLKTAMNRLSDMGALIGGEGVGYEFAIVADPVDSMLGAVQVTLFLRPSFEIKQIRITVSVGQ